MERGCSCIEGEMSGFIALGAFFELNYSNSLTSEMGSGREKIIRTCMGNTSEQAV
jgi:hypothetical protein